MKHVAIVVPYRDRAAHLQQFVPHMIGYLEPQRRAGALDYSIHIIEQQGREKFNRGKLLNCGAALVHDADFIVLHDVDYLPVQADYSPVSEPTRLIWHGLVLREDYEHFFSAVVSFPMRDFQRINGYSNRYWGWGFEDVELRLRCTLSGLRTGRRDGRFRPLPHPHNGFSAPGKPTEAAVANRARIRARLPTLAQDFQQDGLSSLQFARRATIALADRAFLHKVDIGQPEHASDRHRPTTPARRPHS